MFVTQLSLADFRSYPLAEVPLEAGVTVFTGPNGQGKTNLVEAVEYLATLGSHRVAGDAPLVRFGADRALVRARVQAGPDDPRQLLLEIEITPGRANKASLNRSPLKRPRDLLGALRVVVFAPDDLAIVKDDPSERRRFIDDLVTARWPRLAGVRADYDRVLRQRSTLLKSLSGRSARQVPAETASTLDVWDESLAGLGAELVEARLATLADLQPLLERSYAEIAPTRNHATAVYKSAVAVEPGLARDQLAGLLAARMRERRGEEIARGVSLVGPHRDDITLGIGELPARGYASHGESWSLALALRLASFGLLRADGVEPVLVLDDVFAELDEVRRERLAATAVTAQQVLITAAVAADVPAGLDGRHFAVAIGESPLRQAETGADVAAASGVGDHQG
ncbi:MAG: DNA replication/repair protein RecF [Propionicimonas sp.]|uniref:DNA replication/repair protein RecF n=1 Tax=Propionicimonas sp. TaxID=1955623 RepID=UPI002B20D844|nr:DNA replication/repair protein RecF [Propionicimonas sp.]MEA4944440.1 DNA replication/repair protein RecF [Propionicimonas sp.]